MSGADKSLLDRLSALKGGSPGVSLDRSSNALNISLAGIEPAKPPSREDALAARLRSLRNTPERELPPPKVPAPEAPASQQAIAGRGETASLSPTILSRGTHNTTPPQSQVTPFSAPLSGSVDDVDPLLQTDDQTLEDLLSDEDHPLDSDPHQWSFDPKAESAKVAALLEELSKASPGQHAPYQQGTTEKGKEQNSRDTNNNEDDSDGEEMTREAETLLSQALDEAKLNSQPHDVPDPPALLGKSQGTTSETSPRETRGDRQDDGDLRLSLPSVPSTIAAPKNIDDTDDLPGLSLPSVPSGQPKHDAGSEFDNDIAARMAALSGLSGQSDEGMGLPSVPTFQPADRAVKRLTSKTGYTDEDAETWCTVCLEDATLQCLGCEDVYCVRCWHEMHVGSAAAFDDRTHKAVQFVKPKKDKQKKVALGAS
ncbi:zinc fyve domain containing protein [Colletotrichum truncatum]|uniref:Zinc fyve domain containing protein n=1 Tax=Colletotrichum truncatum TaxID=5467 RepID=A0ACC3YTK7_COLTU|nr:zinc fyve domain containing protein [Colletotrichum truncatum]KAF6798432.1 zinc fyve domain containing protein [Colletotrichum truncatum]